MTEALNGMQLLHLPADLLQSVEIITPASLPKSSPRLQGCRDSLTVLLNLLHNNIEHTRNKPETIPGKCHPPGRREVILCFWLSNYAGNNCEQPGITGNNRKTRRFATARQGLNLCQRLPVDLAGRFVQVKL